MWHKNRISEAHNKSGCIIDEQDGKKANYPWHILFSFRFKIEKFLFEVFPLEHILKSTTV